MKSVALHNLGCKVNGYEMDFMQQKLQENGYKIVPFDKCADIYIVNTCTVTNIADKKSRQMLHKAKKMNPDAIVVAVGCYVQTRQESLLEDMSIDLAIGNNKKGELISILEDYMKKPSSMKEGKYTGSQIKTLHGETIIDISADVTYENMTLTETAGNTRAFIKIQDGCNQFCSYCIIPYVRGRVRSRDKQDIIDEVEGLVSRGYKEVVLSGIHISSYGYHNSAALDKLSEKPLLELVEELHNISGLKRIRFGSLEPRIIDHEFIKRAAGLDKLCPHFHLSLQSGCDATLKRMNRHYTAGEYYEKVQLIREWYKDSAITTDIIVGFPGETQEEFEETVRFVKKVDFCDMHVFKYSPRKGTKAAEMENQILPEEKELRSSILIKLGEELSEEYRRRFLHKDLEVLMEESKMIGDTLYQFGYTKEYVRVAVDSDQDLKGSMINVHTNSFLYPTSALEAQIHN